MIANEVKKFVDNYNLSGTFIVAFSGGYDSMCLLDVLNKLNYDVVAVHLNHNWRGEESFNEEQNCKNFAQSKGIKYYTEILPDNVEKTETAARIERYKFFEKCAKKFNSNVIFTAHNFDDNAETVLYRIIKGTGTIGLQGISEHRDIFYRPLLNVKRKEIEAYCKKNQLMPNVDSSNFNVNYKRNFIRHKILPLLNEINPKAIDAINSLSQIAKEENEIINHYIGNNILELSEIEQKRAIYKILSENNIDYDKKKIENIQKFINENKKSKAGKKYSLTKDSWIFVSNKKFQIIKKEEKISDEVQIKNCGNFHFDNYDFTIQEFKGKSFVFPNDNEFKAFIEIDKIDFTIRYRKNGDKILPLGASGSQKLKKYLNEKKIPQHEKDKIVLLCQNNEVLWAAGIGLSDKIKVVNNPTHVITLIKR